MRSYYEARISKKLAVGLDVQWAQSGLSWKEIILLGFGWDFVGAVIWEVHLVLLGFRFNLFFPVGDGVFVDDEGNDDFFMSSFRVDSPAPKDRVELAQDLFDTEQGDDR